MNHRAGATTWWERSLPFLTCMQRSGLAPAGVNISSNAPDSLNSYEMVLPMMWFKTGDKNSKESYIVKRIPCRL